MKEVEGRLKEEIDLLGEVLFNSLESSMKPEELNPKYNLIPREVSNKLHEVVNKLVDIREELNKNS